MTDMDDYDEVMLCGLCGEPVQISDAHFTPEHGAICSECANTLAVDTDEGNTEAFSIAGGGDAAAKGMTGG